MVVAVFVHDVGKLVVLTVSATTVLCFTSFLWIVCGLIFYFFIYHLKKVKKSIKEENITEYRK